MKKAKVFDDQIKEKLSILKQIKPFQVKLDKIISDSFDDRWASNKAIQNGKFESNQQYHQLMENLNQYLQEIDNLRYCVPVELHPDGKQLDDDIEQEFRTFSDLIQQLVLLKQPEKFHYPARKRRRRCRGFYDVSPAKRRRLD